MRDVRHPDQGPGVVAAEEVRLAPEGHHLTDIHHIGAVRLQRAGHDLLPFRPRLLSDVHGGRELDARPQGDGVVIAGVVR